MNWIDYTIFTILFFAAIFGLSSGPVIQFIRIVSLFISFFTALFFYDILSNILKGIFILSTANLLSYFIIFGTAFIVTYIITDLIKKVMDKWNMGIGLRLFGGLLGILKGLVFCGIIILGVLLFCSKPTCAKINTSMITTQIGRGMQIIVSLVPENVISKVKGIKGKEEEIKEDRIPKNTKSFESDGFKATQ